MNEIGLREWSVLAKGGGREMNWGRDLDAEPMTPNTRRVVRVVLLCATLGCILGRFWYRHQGQESVSDAVTLLGFFLMIVMAMLHPRNSKR